MKRWNGLRVAVLGLLLVNLLALHSNAAVVCEAGQHKWQQNFCELCGAKREIFQYGDWKYAVLEDGSAEIVKFEGSLGSGFGTAYSLNVPEEVDGRTVTAIGVNAVNGYSEYDLDAITIPDSVTAIGDFAFGDNPGLTELSISDNVVSLGDNPFAAMDRKYGEIGAVDVKISKNHPTLALIDGVLFDKKNMRLIYYPSSKTETTYEIPQGTKEIGAYAFSDCTTLESIKIPNSVTTIGTGAFHNCGNLQSITIPSSVTRIKGNPFTRTKAAVFLEAGNTALQIKDGSLFSTADMRLISYLPENTASTYKIPDGTREIGRLAFYIHGELTEVQIPSSVAAIDEGAFKWSGLESVKIPDGVRSIGRYAFSYCKMDSVIIPGSVASVGAHAFDNCYNLRQVVLQEGITEIGDYAFWETYLEAIRFPASVTSVGESPFSANTTRIEVADGDPVLEMQGGALFDKNRKRLILFCPDDIYQQYTYVVPEGTQEIGAYAFYYAFGMTQISIPDSVVSIGDSAFCGCSALERVHLPEGLTWIGQSVFYRSGLKEVTIPDAVTSIGSFAFSECDNLKEVTFSAELRAIGNCAFKCSHFLENVELKNKVEYISNSAFYCSMCDRNITIGSSARYIGQRAFESLNPTITLTAEDNSYAEQYCKENGYNYRCVDSITG